MLVTGGSDNGTSGLDIGMALRSELFGEDDGATVADRWSLVSGSFIARHRASVALLLRDGRVWITGRLIDGTGPYCDKAGACSGPAGDSREYACELFEPWYIHRTDRPVINACPATFSGNPSTRDISIAGGEGEQIVKVALMSPGSVTHSFNSGQRLLWLGITQKRASAVTVEIPYADAAAPPGDYMVFVLKQNPRPGGPSIPSVGCWTKR